MILNTTTKKALIKSAVICALALGGVAAHAKSYMTLDLGQATQETVSKTLKSANAQFNTEYGYKGYSDLAIFEVTQYQAFSKHGSVKESWLYFAPDDTLYRFEVTYADAGQLYQRFLDALNSKYTRVSHNGHGFTKVTKFNDGDFQITLTRNEFGFGSDQKTTIEYVDKTALPDVARVKKQIDQYIAQQNAKKAGDL